MKQAPQDQKQELGNGATSLEFGQFRVDLTRRILLRDDTRVRIQKKPLALLIYLIQESPRMVSREELLDRFWHRTINEEVLTRCISTIRKHLSDNEHPSRFIETYRGQGYRFIPNVVESASTETVDSLWIRRRGRLEIAGAIVAAILIMAVSFWPERDPDPAVGGRIERIAVLPLSAPDSGPGWLQPALTDHVMHAVSSIEGITVISSTVDTDDLDVQAHGKDINVEAILLTRLDRNSTGSTLSARLVAVEDNALLWSAIVDSDYQFSSGEQVQQMARQLAIRLRPTLQLGDQIPQVDQRAYSYYLQGRYYWGQRSAIGLEAAISAYDAALAIEPEYVAALIGSAESWLLLPLYGAMAPDEAIPISRRLAERALEIDPASGRARAVLGVVAMQFEWNWTKAESLLREAVTLNPNDATAQQWLGELFCHTLRFDECSRQLRVAFELDPLSPVLRMQQGSPALFSGDFASAISIYAEATRIAPEYPLGRYVIGLACAGVGEWDQAVAAYRASLPDLGLAIVGGPLIYALGQAGADDEARQILAELESLAKSRYVPPSKLAVAYLGIQDRDRALAELWRAVEVHDDRLVYYRNDIHFRHLIAEDGFRDIATRIGFE